MKNIARFGVLFTSTLAISMSVQERASAANVGYTDYTAYQLAASGDELIENFDNLAGGDVLTTLGDITFTAGTVAPVGLQIYVTDGTTTDTVSPANYVGTTNVIFPTIEEFVTINFGSPRSAAGIFVVTQDAAPSIGIGLGSSQIFAADAHELYISTQSFFLGFVDDTGANSISSITLGGFGSGFFFDSQTSFINTVPEPNAALMLAGLMVGAVSRRRRK